MITNDFKEEYPDPDGMLSAFMLKCKTYIGNADLWQNFHNNSKAGVGKLIRSASRNTRSRSTAHWPVIP
jgi:hypothetical protein